MMAKGARIEQKSKIATQQDVIVGYVKFTGLLSVEGDTLQQGVELLPTLLQSFEKSAASQQQMTAELATSGCLISALLTADNLPGKLMEF